MIVFFFFQAEDGIRDGHVTGVQTCALPICCRDHPFDVEQEGHSTRHPEKNGGPGGRSEERRVGKEGRSRWSPDHEKKKICSRGGYEGRRAGVQERVRPLRRRVLL